LLGVSSGNRKSLERRVDQAAEAALEKRKFVTAIER
jgi:hypothetical protein